MIEITVVVDLKSLITMLYLMYFIRKSIKKH